MTSILTKSEFDKICRTCLEIKEEMISVHTTEIVNMLQSCSTIKISENDSLPTQICPGCVCKTYDCFKFKKLCEDSEQLLREILNEHDDKRWFDIEQVKDKVHVALHVDDTGTVKLEPENEVSGAKESAKRPRNKCITKMKRRNESSISETGCNYDSYSESNSDKDDSGFEFPPDPTIWTSRKNNQSIRKARINWILSLGPEKCDPDAFTCKICNKVLVNINSLGRHMETHDEKRKFLTSCHICNKGFYEKGNLTKHMRRHQRQAKYQCEKCKKPFYELSALAVHMSRSHHVAPVACAICSKEFMVHQQLEEHMKSHNSKTPNHSCTQCEKKFEYAYQLNRHVFTHGDRIYPCLQCDNVFKSPYVLQAHQKQFHTNVAKQKVVCSVCGKAVLHIKLHMLRHNGGEPLPCALCPKTFARKCDLDAHRKKKHPLPGEPAPYPYLCSSCGKRCETSSALQRHHIHVHTSERAFSCPNCEKDFKSANALAAHVRCSHTEDRRFVCSICAKAFHTNAILKNHIRTHTGERPYICQLCGRAFTQNSALRTHMKIHAVA